MSRWVLYCPECKRQFAHGEIPVNALRDGCRGVELKPGFPQGGLNMECPYCTKISLFQRYQLIYVDQSGEETEEEVIITIPAFVLTLRGHLLLRFSRPVVVAKCLDETQTDDQRSRL